MKSATIRDLRNSFPRVARWIEEGESVEITRSGKPFAKLSPAPVAKLEKPSMPDFMERLSAQFPKETAQTHLPPVVEFDRDNR
jgi:antitoxin (DNA-binding transcriptional repressor) of toxin-antitoxin stability system